MQFLHTVKSLRNKYWLGLSSLTLKESNVFRHSNEKKRFEKLPDTEKSQLESIEQLNKRAYLLIRYS